MIRRNPILVLVCCAWQAWVLPAAAQQAVVRSYDDTAGLEIGQAFLTHYAGRCHALLPTHVVDETGGMPALLKEGGALLGEGATVADLGDDLAIAELTGSVTSDCGYGLSTISRAVARRINDSGLAVIRSVNGDGTVAQLAVTIVDDDGESLLRVQPTNADTQIRKGQSGSMLMIGDTPVGMLLSVSARAGVGTVMRLDRMLEKADAHLAAQAVVAASPSAAGRDAGAAAGGSVPGTAGVATIVAWNVMPVDAAHRAANLTAADATQAWIADVPRWPVEIEIDLGGERRAIGSIVFHGQGVPDAGALPAVVEIFINVATGARQWRSLTGGALRFDDGKATVRFAPVWARQVRVVFSGAADGGARIALRRIVVGAP